MKSLHHALQRSTLNLLVIMLGLFFILGSGDIVITINGDNPVTVVQGSIYVDAGATAKDDDGDLDVITTGLPIDTSIVGTYEVTYTATGGDGEKKAIRTVHVVESTEVDTEAPVITITGDNPVNILKGATYTDAGATATDNIDGNVTVSATSTVDMTTVGDYAVTYTASDTAGNVATATRVVSVTESAATVTISGKAPIVGGNVVIKDLLGVTFATGITGTDGGYSIDINESDIADGYEIVVTGGQMDGENFTGELRAVYSASDDRDKANVTLITSLLKKFSETFSGATLLEKKEKAVLKLISLGMLKDSNISGLDLDFVNENVLRQYIIENSLSNVLDVLIADISDDALNVETMRVFPFANGGIRRVIAGSNEPISLYAGKGKQLRVGVESIQVSSPVQNIIFTLENAPAWITLIEDVVSITPPDNTEAKDYNFVVNATANGVTIGKKVAVKVTIINQVLLVSGSLGASGGKIENQWKDIVISANAGDLTQEYAIKYFAGINSNGALSYRFKTTPEMPISERLKVKVIKPSSEIIRNNYLLPSLPAEQRSSVQQKILARQARLSSVSSQSATGVAQVCVEELPRWYDGNTPVSDPDGHTFDYIWQGKKGLFHDTWDVDLQGFPRVLSSVTTNSGVDDLHEKCTSSLRSSVMWDDESLTLKEPVLFVHGFISSGKLGGLDINPELLWDDKIEEYFGSFPKMSDDVNISGRKFNSFLFQWRTNALFQDVATELGEAIKEITEKTGKQVHIVAHSFGGLLTRTLVQGLSTNTEFNKSFAEKNIATITTVGTPHSGIFAGVRLPSSRNIEFNNEGKVQFPIGTDSYAGALIKACKAIACYQAGEPWDQLSDSSESIGAAVLYGTKDHEGFIVYKLAKTINSYPDIPTQVLMGIVPADVECKKSGENTCRLTYTFDSAVTDHPGDMLISIEGQRFLPSLNLEPIYRSTFVNEHILPFKTKDFSVGSSDNWLNYMSGGVNLRVGGVTYPDEIPVTFYKSLPFMRSKPKLSQSLASQGFYYGNNHRSGKFDKSNTIINSITGFTFTEKDSGGNETIKEHKGSLHIKNLTEVGLQTCRTHAEDCDHPTWLYFHDLVSNNEAQAVQADVQITTSGTVVSNLITNNSSQQNPVSGAIVSVYQGTELVEKTQTGEDGSFTLSVIFRPNSPYRVSVVPPPLSTLRGIESEVIQTADTIEESVLNFDKLVLTDLNFFEGDIGISVVNGTNGQSLSDFDIEIKNHVGNIVESSHEDGSLITFTLPVGSYRVKIAKEGYLDNEQTCNVEKNASSSCSINIIPTGHVAEGTLTAVLTWQVDPRDLDSHLIKYDASGSRLYHIYYPLKGQPDPVSGDILDVDDTTSYGPETVTIQNIDATAKYIYAIYQYSESGSITTTSGAKVNIQTGSFTRTYNAPTTGEGRWWKVFEVLNGRVIPCQSGCILSDSDTVFRTRRGIFSKQADRKSRWFSDMLDDLRPEKISDVVK